MAAWELTEFLVLEGPHVTHVRLTLALHSVQVLLVVAVTWVVIRAWQERTRHEDALTRMVEKVVVAQEEERRRIAHEVHDGIAQLIVSAKQHVDTARGVAADDPDRADRETGRAAQRLERAIIETRRVLQALRPSAVDSVGLVEAMRLRPRRGRTGSRMVHPLRRQARRRAGAAGGRDGGLPNLAGEPLQCLAARSEHERGGRAESARALASSRGAR